MMPTNSQTFHNNAPQNANAAAATGANAYAFVPRGRGENPQNGEEPVAAAAAVVNEEKEESEDEKLEKLLRQVLQVLQENDTRWIGFEGQWYICIPAIMLA